MCFICVRLECVMTVFVWGIHFGFSPKNKKKTKLRISKPNRQQPTTTILQQQTASHFMVQNISNISPTRVNCNQSCCKQVFSLLSRKIATKIEDLQQRLSLFNSTHTHAIVIENYNKKCFVKLRSEVICQNCTIK